MVKIAAVFRREQMMRKSLVAGNWKMHGSTASIEELLAGLTRDVLAQGKQSLPVDVVVCPTYVHISQVLSRCAGSAIEIGSQDCSHVASGAFTGEVAAAMLQELGCRWVVIGHSERRQYHGESDDLVAAKLTAAIESGLTPIVCVGETREQRESGDAESVVASQLMGALQGQACLEGVVVAYEPVWAIGTGLTATPEEAQDMHAFIRGQLSSVTGINADATRVVYGGSVKGSNAVELFAQQDIDGALVGGAALVASEFLAIVKAAAA
ncbi:MAG: triosephosphate isomerase [Halioglobus sp.]